MLKDPRQNNDRIEEKKEKAEWSPLYFLYQSLTVLFLPVVFLFLAARLAARPAYREGIAQRFGWYPDDFFLPLRGRKVFWVHAVSVGEVLSSRLLIQSLRERYPHVAIVFSTVTPTGQAAARRHLEGVDRFIYFPFDLIWVARSVVRKISPALFIFLETEIWPNCLLALSENKTPCVLLNGRLSERGFRRYRKIRFFLSEVFPKISIFLMQTGRDVEKMVDLGAPSDRVELTGNIKYDQAVSKRGSEGIGSLRAELGLRREEVLAVAGSTHEGEEEAVLEAYSLLIASFPTLVLMIAPRHLERLAGIERLISQKGFGSIRKGSISAAPPEEAQRPLRIILLDTLGELDRFYPPADLIFVGGSLVPVGGHNILEPAACRKPILFGPFMANFQEIADQLKGSGGGMEVANGREIGEKMRWLLEHPEEYRKKGESAYQTVLKNLGAVNRNLERISKWADRRV